MQPSLCRICHVLLCQGKFHHDMVQLLRQTPALLFEGVQCNIER